MPITLAPILDTAAAGPLRLALRQAVEHHDCLILDGSAVERVGQACLQVMTAAMTTAATLGISFRITDASGPLVEMATLAGLADLLA